MLAALINSLIQEELPGLIQIRRALHENPGIKYQETYANEVVQRELTKASIPFRSGLAGGTGIVAHLPGQASRAIGLRADMDALPIKEQNTFMYASKNPGVMHACGHDGHTAILIGTALVLARLAKKNPLPRPVTFVFQPAEEGGAGGAAMIKDGCLDESLFAPAVEHMFALHGWPELECGRVATRLGPITAATYEFQVTVKGLGCHAAFPHFGRDPLVAAAAIITAAQSIVARNVDPLKAAVVSITQCHAGTASNIISGEVTLAGTIRALDLTIEKLVTGRFSQLAQQIAAAHDCIAEVTYLPSAYPVTINAPEAIELLKSALPQIETDMAPVMGGEDFAFYSQKVPSALFVIGLRPGAEKVPGLHHPSFDFNDDAIQIGIETFCRLALGK